MTENMNETMETIVEAKDELTEAANNAETSVVKVVFITLACAAGAAAAIYGGTKLVKGALAKKAPKDGVVDADDYSEEDVESEE